MNTALGIVGGLIVGAAIGVGGATVYKNKMPGATGGNAAAVGGPLIEIDSKTYSEEDLPSDVRAQVFEARSESHERINGLLNQYALQLTMAKEKGVDVTKGPLPSFEELVVVPAPTEAEMLALFESNKARLPPDTKFETIKGDIERYVKNQKMSETLRTKNEEFKTANRVKFLSAAPEAPKVDLELTGYAAKGSASAPTLVEVADYLCPHCQATQPEVEALIKDMGDKVHFVSVPFALRPDNLSGNLARGAYCAKTLGDDSFWKYHEAAFRISRTKGWKATDPAANEPVIEVVKDAALDEAKMTACIDSPEAIAFVKKTVESFNAAGVSGTPTFFYEGRRLAMKPTLKETLASVMPASSH